MAESKNSSSCQIETNRIKNDTISPPEIHIDSHPSQPEKKASAFSSFNAPLKKTWRQMTKKDRAIKVAKILAIVLALISLLLIFFSSISLLGNSFKVLTAKSTNTFFSFAEKSIAGLCIGILSTLIFQSSSTTTSLTVTLVVSGALTVKHAIPIVMGANIGTSITNTIVSFGHIRSKTEFRKATEGATVHDFFNVAVVLILLPLEQIPMYKGRGLLEMISYFAVKPIEKIEESGKVFNPIKFLTVPITGLFMNPEKCLLNLVHNSPTILNSSAQFYALCTKQCSKICENNTGSAETNCSKCVLENLSFIKTGIFSYFNLSDLVASILSLIVAIIFIVISLFLIVKIMSRSLKNKTSSWIKKALLKHALVAMCLGCLITVMMQSSSITTSTLVPLVALNVITLEQMFPLTLGANVGTTLTSILAAAVEGNVKGFQIAICHLLFNILGILIFYPIPYLRSFPLECARALGYQVGRWKIFGILYVAITFVLIPTLLLLLSFAPGGSIIGPCILYAALLAAFIWRQVRVRAPNRIPLWCPNVMRPNAREYEAEMSMQERRTIAQEMGGENNLMLKEI